jgi:hypothetical protein
LQAVISPGTKKRISRIRRRAEPEVQAAFEAGKISASRADQLLYLEPSRQLAELDRILAAQQNATQRSRIAAAVIREHLNRGAQPSLAALREDLRLALASSTIQSYVH